MNSSQTSILLSTASDHGAWDFQDGPLLWCARLFCILWKLFLSVLVKCWMPFLFLVTFSKPRQDSVHQEGMQRSFLWPECLSGENTILGFPRAVCMISEGTDHKDFKGTLGPGEEMKSSPLPLVLCILQPRKSGGLAYWWLQVYAGGSDFKVLWHLNKGLRFSFAIESTELFCKVRPTPRNKIQKE